MQWDWVGVWEIGCISINTMGDGRDTFFIYLEVGYNTRKEQGREMFGGGGGGKVTNCLPVIFLLSAFLIQTMAR